MSKFYAIDCSSLLVSAYYGTLPNSIKYAKTDEEKVSHYGEIMHDSHGTYVNAVYTTLKSILKLINDDKPDYIVAAFDKSRNTFRREIYPDYKANRSEIQSPLKQQFILMENILEQIGLNVLYSDDYEADDLIGSVVETFKHNKTNDFYLLTKDHDYRATRF